MVGTVCYMAPEQALGGRRRKPRSDLYSLGCVLYEMVTGRPPFVGDETVADHRPAPEHAAGRPHLAPPRLPAGLEALILRLLEKDPSKRPAVRCRSRARPGVGHRVCKSPRPDSDRPEACRRPRPPLPPDLRRPRGRAAQLQNAFDAGAVGPGRAGHGRGRAGHRQDRAHGAARHLRRHARRTRAARQLLRGRLALAALPAPSSKPCAPTSSRASPTPCAPSSAPTPATSPASSRRCATASRSSCRRPATPRTSAGGCLQAVTVFLRNASTVQPLAHRARRPALVGPGHARPPAAPGPQPPGRAPAGRRHLPRRRGRPHPPAVGRAGRAAASRQLQPRHPARPRPRRRPAHDVGRSPAARSWRATAEQVHRQTEGNPLFVQEVVRYLVEEGLIAARRRSWRPRRRRARRWRCRSPRACAT